MPRSPQKRVINLQKKIALVVDDEPYIITLDRYSSIEISISLDKSRIDVVRKPRGGHNLHGIFFNEVYQSKLNFEHYGNKETETVY